MENIFKSDTIDSDYRQKKTGNTGLVVWFFGLSASGKTTIAKQVEKRLVDDKKLVYLLDGDNIRHGLNSDLGFSCADRQENIRRMAEVAALFEDCGVITLVSAITPFEKMRVDIKRRMKRCILVFVDTDIDTCIQRDPKGLYKKAIAGEIADFTGISSVFERPQLYDVHLDTDKKEINQCVDEVISSIERAMNGSS